MYLRRLAWVALALISSVALLAADPAGVIELTNTPAPVQKTIQAQVGAGRLGEINQTNQDGETLFAVTFTTSAGVKRDLSVAEDGTVLSLEVGLFETPVAVQKTIRSQATGWNLSSIDRVVNDGETNFDVAISRAGQDKSFVVGDQGGLVRLERTITETPAEVQATIKTRVGDGTVKFIDEYFDLDGNTFAVEAVAKAGDKDSFCVDADGRLLSEEVTLEQTSPAVRQAIQAQIGTGKILRIDKSLLERKGGVLPYQVQGYKDGKPFDFSVGPRGRLLSVDD